MNYKKTTLPNGLRIITIPAKGNPAVTIMALVETGSNYENLAQNGLSHFLEHMMFKGTTKRPTSLDISKELDSLGAQSNAFTSNEMTGYWAKAEKKNFPKLLDIISDMYLNPTLPSAELEKERGVILQEISMYEDLPQRKVWYVFSELLFGNVPAGRAILGPAKNIKSFTRKNFDDYRKAHYVAGKTILIVAGDVAEGEVVRLAKTAFAKIPKGKKIGKQPVALKQKRAQMKVHFKKTDQTHLILGFPAYDANHKNNAALAVLAGVLGQGMSSRLFQKMREELGICYYVRTGHEGATDHGSFIISSGVDNKRVEEGVAAIIEECRKLTLEKVSPEELKKTKDFLVGNLYMGLETTDALAEFYAEQEVTKMGKDETPSRIEREVRRVTAADIQRVAKDIFQTKKLNLAIVGDVKNQARLKKLLII